MAIGPVTRVAAVSGAGPVSRPSAPQVRMDLPSSIAVEPTAPADAGGGAGRHPRRPADLTAFVERHLTIDPQTRLVVSQIFDQDTGELLSQVPDQALLRLKAYARKMVAALDARTGRLQRIA